jgi:hypothetical protein
MFCQRMCGRKAKRGRRLCQECRDRTQLREAQRYDHRVRQDSGRGFHDRRERRGRG